MMMKQLLLTGVIFLMLLSGAPLQAQQRGMGKMSPWLRHIARQETSLARQGASLVRQDANQANRVSAYGETTDRRQVCALADVATAEVLPLYGSRSLAEVGGVHIVSIPIGQLRSLAADPRVRRIEAHPLGTALNDSMAIHLNALPAYAGTDLPQPFTGKGVVVGIMDIGFDLTQPNFYSRDTTQYRIKRLWDMLSTDTVGSEFYVGRDYTTRDELLKLQHSRDGRDMTHGTYTLGIAAGSGYTSNYRGMAPESDICLVANAVSNNAAYIDSVNYYKYTYATDALGFKYIYDYATSVNKPCVISFSEGSSQDFRGDDLLYYKMIKSMVGPGRILVSAAGNRGWMKDWIHKERGELSKGVFLYAENKTMIVTTKSRDDFSLRVVAYREKNDTLTINTREVMSAQDSTLNTVLDAGGAKLNVQVEAYPSCYDDSDMCYDLTINGESYIGFNFPISFEVVGSDADVEVYRVNGSFGGSDKNRQLEAGERTHNILSPSSSPDVICVGATAYRLGVINHEGKYVEFDDGKDGERAGMSSVGPTFDGRIKPDVMAPGINVISSYSSFYIEEHPNASDASGNMFYYDFNGRTYTWNCNSGTSGSSPAVAGVIALWLEACPTLSPEDVMDVIAHTSRHNDPTLSYPNNLYGWGEIDAYGGLLYLLGADKIDGVTRDPSKVRVSVTGEGAVRLVLPEPAQSAVKVTVYELSGKVKYRQRLVPGESEYLLPSLRLSRGQVYVVQIDGDAAVKGSLIIKG